MFAKENKRTINQNKESKENLKGKKKHQEKSHTICNNGMGKKSSIRIGFLGR